MDIWFIILVMAGIFIAPVFTIGCILMHFDLPVIAIFAFLISFIRGNQIARLKGYIYILQEEIKRLKSEKKVD